MDWMYNSSTKVDPEDYLLGKPIDKGHFEEPSTENFMRSIKDEPASSHSQVELSRRVREDPLTMIREKEYEKRKILWKKSQIKNSDTKLVPIQVSTEDQPENESKSIHQLIVENLRQLPFKIDLEKFYVRLKEKKKEKKLRKKKNVSSPDGASSSEGGKVRRPESEGSSRFIEKRPGRANDYRRDNYRRGGRSSSKDGRSVHENSRHPSTRKNLPEGRTTAANSSSRPRSNSRSSTIEKRRYQNSRRPDPRSRRRSSSEDGRPNENNSKRPRPTGESPIENRRSPDRSAGRLSTNSKTRLSSEEKCSRRNNCQRPNPKSRDQSSEDDRQLVSGDSRRRRSRDKSSDDERPPKKNPKPLTPRKRSSSADKRTLQRNISRSKQIISPSERRRLVRNDSRRRPSSVDKRTSYRNTKRSRSRSRSSSEERSYSRRKNPRPRKILKSRHDRSTS